MRTRWSGLAIGKLPPSERAHILDGYLREYFLPYWYQACDWAHAGYLLDDVHRSFLGRLRMRARRRFSGPTPRKIIVSQARLVYVFSLAHRLGYSDAERDYLRAAECGYKFLIGRMRDEQQEGFCWSVEPTGRVLDARKFLYGQAMAIYALIEYYRASGLVEPLEVARRVFQASSCLHDVQNLGWFEHATASWEPMHSSSEQPFGTVDVIGLKSGDGHLHWMEALTELYSVTADPDVRKTLAEVLNVNLRYFYPADPTDACPFRTFDWQPTQGLRFDGVSYGHQVEFAWLMIRAQQALQIPCDWDHFDKLVNNALEFGFDHTRGGFYDRGEPNQPARVTEKIWWVQAEGLAALSSAVQSRLRNEYSVALERLLDWIFESQICPDGIWMWSADSLGYPINLTKAAAWKAGYHEMRALTMLADTCSH